MHVLSENIAISDLCELIVVCVKRENYDQMFVFSIENNLWFNRNFLLSVLPTGSTAAKLTFSFDEFGIKIRRHIVATGDDQ